MRQSRVKKKKKQLKDKERKWQHLKAWEAEPEEASNKLRIREVKEIINFRVLLIPAMPLCLPQEQQGYLGLQLQAVNRLSWRLNISQ